MSEAFPSSTQVVRLESSQPSLPTTSAWLASLPPRTAGSPSPSVKSPSDMIRGFQNPYYMRIMDSLRLLPFNLILRATCSESNCLMSSFMLPCYVLYLFTYCNSTPGYDLSAPLSSLPPSTDLVSAVILCLFVSFFVVLCCFLCLSLSSSSSSRVVRVSLSYFLYLVCLDLIVVGSLEKS